MRSRVGPGDYFLGVPCRRRGLTDIRRSDNCVLLLTVLLVLYYADPLLVGHERAGARPVCIGRPVPAEARLPLRSGICRARSVIIV